MNLPDFDRRARLLTRSLASVIAALCVAPVLHAAHVPEILIMGQATYDDRDAAITAAEIDPGLADANRLIERIPGGGNNDNGPLSGQLQYRGLFGPRMGTSVDGAAIQSAGPNWMDSPLHYAPAGLIDSFAFSRGLTSISHGAGLGGAARVSLKQSRFIDAGTDFSGNLSLSGHSADSGYNATGFLALANETHRGHLRIARDDGDDFDSGDGTVKDTAYERDYYGVGYGVKLGDHELAVDYTHVDTGPTGNPVLPLDLAFFDTDMVNGSWRFAVGDVAFEARAYYVDIDHQMDNFRQRRTPDFSALPLPPFVGTDERFVDVTGETVGFALHAAYDALGGVARAGFDGRLDDHDATVGDPDVPMFFIDNINRAENDVWSFFGEWRGRLIEPLSVEIGARYSRVEQDAATVDAQPAQIADAMPMMCAPGATPVPPPCAVRALRDRFNASDRARGEDLVDWLARFTWTFNETLSTELGFARKSRAPSYVERYLWIPLEVNAGLGDGNNYVGDVTLDPEVAHKVELGLDWRTDKAYVAPRIYYHRVSDYIQGTAIAPSRFNMPVIGVSRNANGDATPLRFSNVDAELYGVDLLAGIDLPADFRGDLAYAWVRGKRRDIDDDLYRIAPPRLRLNLGYVRPDWFLQLETVFTARQEHISQALTLDPGNANNSNAETPGYILLNLRGQAELPQGFRLNFGIENLLDLEYRDHLTGFNRVLGSDVPVGQRLPGRGVNGYVTLGYTF